MIGLARKRVAWRKFRRDERGGPLAELALILPFLLILLFGAFEIARLLWLQYMITKGVQDAARYAARHPASIDSGSCVPGSAAWTNVVTNAQTIATRGDLAATTLHYSAFTPSTVTVAVNCVAPAGSMVTSNPGAGANVPIVVVSAAVPVTDIGFFKFVSATAITLRAEHRELAVGL